LNTGYLYSVLELGHSFRLHIEDISATASECIIILSQVLKKIWNPKYMTNIRKERPFLQVWMGEEMYICTPQRQSRDFGTQEVVGIEDGPVY
jgi:hypothetical protein